MNEDAVGILMNDDYGHIRTLTPDAAIRMQDRRDFLLDIARQHGLTAYIAVPICDDMHLSFGETKSYPARKFRSQYTNPGYEKFQNAKRFRVYEFCRALLEDIDLTNGTAYMATPHKYWPEPLDLDALSTSLANNNGWTFPRWCTLILWSRL